MDVFLIYEDTTLLAGCDKVEMDEETHPRVERDPVEDEVELALNEEEEGEGGPVHEPWCEVLWNISTCVENAAVCLTYRWVTGPQSLV